MTDDRLTSAQAAEVAGVKPSSWRVYVSRGDAPQPDGMIDGRTPFWLRSTIETWQQTRGKR
jgi:predicted DNA-binding transcriptional regulator AlpA